MNKLFSSVFNIACKDATIAYWQILQQHAKTVYWLQANWLKPFASFYHYQLLQRAPS